jgi:transposase
VSDLFGVRGRTWLASLELQPDERLTVDAAIALDAVLSEQVAAAARAIAAALVDDPRARRLLMIPGIGLIVAASILAIVGDIDRFDRDRDRGDGTQARRAGLAPARE